MGNNLKEKLNTPGNIAMCPAAIIVRDKKILLGLRNYTPDKWKKISVWTSPGGRCDKGETIEGALRREVREETGINNLEIIDFISDVLGAKEGDTVPMFFCATNQSAKLMEPEKFSEWRWVPIKEYLLGGVWDDMNPEAHKIISDYLNKKFYVLEQEEKRKQRE